MRRRAGAPGPKTSARDREAGRKRPGLVPGQAWKPKLCPASWPSRVIALVERIWHSLPYRPRVRKANAKSKAALAAFIFQWSFDSNIRKTAGRERMRMLE